MYSFKEKHKLLRNLNNPEMADVDLKLLKKLFPSHNLAARSLISARRYAEDILYALLDVATAEAIRQNRREAAKEVAVIAEADPDPAPDSEDPEVDPEPEPEADPEVAPEKDPEADPEPEIQESADPDPVSEVEPVAEEKTPAPEPVAELPKKNSRKKTSTLA